MKELKNIKIDAKLHQDLKIYCVVNNIKINEFIEDIVLKAISPIKKVVCEK